jgi:hypothetical protein
LKPGEAEAVLDAIGIDDYCERIVAGKTITAVAEEIGVSRRALLNWLCADPARSLKAREARILSAAAFDDMAEKVVQDAADAFGLAKARELAQHYRWRSAKIDPAYHDTATISVGGASGLPPIQVEQPPTLEVARRLAFVFATAKHEAEKSAKVEFERLLHQPPGATA